MLAVIGTPINVLAGRRAGHSRSERSALLTIQPSLPICAASKMFLGTFAGVCTCSGAAIPNDRYLQESTE